MGDGPCVPDVFGSGQLLNHSTVGKSCFAAECPHRIGDCERLTSQDPGYKGRESALASYQSTDAAVMIESRCSSDLTCLSCALHMPCAGSQLLGAPPV